MVDQSRSNLLRERLCASGDSHLVILGETLTDEQFDTLLRWAIDGTLKKIRDAKAL
jgi:hypothetical protein